MSTGEENLQEVRIEVPDRDMDELMGVINDFVSVKGLPIVVGEASPRASDFYLPNRERDPRYASIPYNSTIVSFVSMGKDEEGKPQPSVPNSS